MNVRLIAVTKPVAEEIKNFTSEELTAYVARVSNPANQMNSETSSKLLGYCIKNSHWSVFEHISMTVEIKTSRAIAAQILRHRSFCFQEFSQRYAEAVDIEVYQARRQDQKNRQNSVDDLDPKVNQWFQEAQNKLSEISMALYKKSLEYGIAKEQARFLLPMATSTTLYMTGNVRNWIHYVDLRSSHGTQLEHKEIALGIKEIMIKEFPDISNAKGWVNV